MLNLALSEAIMMSQAKGSTNHRAIYGSDYWLVHVSYPKHGGYHGSLAVGLILRVQHRLGSFLFSKLRGLFPQVGKHAEVYPRGEMLAGPGHDHCPDAAIHAYLSDHGIELVHEKYVEGIAYIGAIEGNGRYGAIFLQNKQLINHLAPPFIVLVASRLSVLKELFTSLITC
jgi:hypothetical protein